MATLKSDISKNEDKLKELDQYRDFLTSLAPSEWQEEQEGQRARDASAAERAQSPEIKFETVPEGAGANDEAQGHEGGAAEPRVELRKLFFTKPKQLLEIYAELESHNLSLITNGQETEEALQDLEERINLEETRMAKERKYLECQIEELKTEIRNEEDLAWFARERTSYFSSNNVDLQERHMQELNDKVAQVYTVCIGENEVCAGFCYCSLPFVQNHYLTVGGNRCAALRTSLAQSSSACSVGRAQ